MQKRIICKLYHKVHVKTQKLARSQSLISTQVFLRCLIITVMTYRPNFSVTFICASCSALPMNKSSGPLAYCSWFCRLRGPVNQLKCLWEIRGGGGCTPNNSFYHPTFCSDIHSTREPILKTNPLIREVCGPNIRGVMGGGGGGIKTAIEKGSICGISRWPCLALCCVCRRRWRDRSPVTSKQYL